MPEGMTTPVVVAQGRMVVEGGATPVPVNDNGGSLTVDGVLTDAELRAAPVPVSGPLTDAELRAATVPVSTASDTPLATQGERAYTVVGASVLGPINGGVVVSTAALDAGDYEVVVSCASNDNVGAAKASLYDAVPAETVALAYLGHNAGASATYRLERVTVVQGGSIKVLQVFADATANKVVGATIATRRVA